MGRRAVSVRDEIRGSARLDRHAERGGARSEDIAAGRCAEPAEDGSLLPGTPAAEEDSATHSREGEGEGEGEVALHELWFALPRHEQEQFGGHFSRLLLRMIQQQATLSSPHSEPAP
jgi:hypothetical protein